MAKGCFSRRVRIQNLPSPLFYFSAAELAWGRRRPRRGKRRLYSRVPRLSPRIFIWLLCFILCACRSASHFRTVEASVRLDFYFFSWATLDVQKHPQKLWAAAVALYVAAKKSFFLNSVCIKLLRFLSSVISVHRDVFISVQTWQNSNVLPNCLVPIIPVPAVICATLQHIYKKYYYFLIQLKNSKQKSNNRSSFGCDEIMWRTETRFASKL